ncbi:MAG: nucleotidyl transferase AbiEii/AbiGii toxin family protein [Candidatus Moranbacteria bacterium]|nr:nucleotidyl transferase AbiEii/AbiGii toxin family protein [Candidatus Moranbacteria bacterium]
MLNRKKHRKVIFEIIREIYSGPVGAWLGFKGGTMLYFFYGLDRFSVDLDFDLLNLSKAKEVFNETEKILKQYGKLEDKMDKNFTLLFELRYEVGMQSVKVEINKRVSPKNNYEMKNFYGTAVKALKIEDSFAHKLIASTNRKAVANRDFYDIWFLFKNGFFPNEEIIKDYTGKSAKDYCSELKKFVEDNFSSNPLAGLGELIEPDRKEWVKRSLKAELLAQIDFYINN